MTIQGAHRTVIISYYVITHYTHTSVKLRCNSSQGTPTDIEAKREVIIVSV